jgi:hypothetical protein
LDQRIDAHQGLVSLGRRVHFQIEADTKIVVAQKSCAAKQRGAGGEGAQMRGIVGADDRRPAAAKKQGHDALRLDPRNLAELLLEFAGPLQDGRRPGIRRLEHDERLFAFGKHLSN